MSNPRGGEFDGHGGPKQDSQAHRKDLEEVRQLSEGSRITALGYLEDGHVLPVDKLLR
jgi:hypothetical protein